MNWTARKVLVTGAAGFIGSRLSEVLAERGANVRAFIRYTARGSLGNLTFLPRSLLGEIEVIRGDLRDPEAIRKASESIDTVFHLGALIAIPYSYMNPRGVVETNILGTLNLLEAARTQSLRRLVYASSSEVYGSARYTPIDEAHPLRAQSPYAASKIGAEGLLESFHRSFEVPVVTVRPFNTYGPRQSMRAVIPTIIIQALRRGGEVKLGSLTPRRDFTFVDDTITGFIRAAEADGVCGEEFNLGAGAGFSVQELAHMIFEQLGVSGRIVEDRRRIRPENSEVVELLASTRKAMERLGWYPEVTLAEGLKRTIGWFRDHLESYPDDEYAI